MAENLNKINTLYFEGVTMKELFEKIQMWQNKEQKRLLSISIQKDGDYFACIALTNPTEVVITSRDGSRYVDVNYDHQLFITESRDYGLPI
jgi:hypothetical protein